jgi:hypothetical protein
MSQVSNNTPDCPVDCGTNPLEVEFSLCAPETNAGQIRYIYVGIPGSCFADWTNAAEWANRIDAPPLNPNKIVRLTVLADKPRPTKNEIKGSLDRIFSTTKDHIINITIDETNNANYDGVIRKGECNSTYPIWYATKKKMYGGNCGITATLNIDDALPREGLETFEGDAKWSEQFHPERIDNPIAD